MVSKGSSFTISCSSSRQSSATSTSTVDPPQLISMVGDLDAGVHTVFSRVLLGGGEGDEGVPSMPPPRQLTLTRRPAASVVTSAGDER